MTDTRTERMAQVPAARVQETRPAPEAPPQVAAPVAPQVPVVPVVPEVPVATCTCGHIEEAHEHWRRGSDCGVCGAAVCSRFRRAR